MVRLFVPVPEMVEKPEGPGPSLMGLSLYVQANDNGGWQPDVPAVKCAVVPAQLVAEDRLGLMQEPSSSRNAGPLLVVVGPLLAATAK